MRRYFGRKLLIYVLTFFVAVTINWMIPRFMPGDPIQSMIARAPVTNPEAFERMQAYYTDLFGLDRPLWQQYFSFWGSLLQGDLGTSIWIFPRSVTSLVAGAVPYTIALMVPAILLSWVVGNNLGAFAARRKALDNTILPFGYLLTSTPPMWLAIMLLWAVAIVGGLLPVSGGYSRTLSPDWSLTFAQSLLEHWFLPFTSLFLVALGGWAIGMRNMIIYELEADYANYLESLGAPRRLVRRYAFRNAMLPQITGLALQLGVLFGGALVIEIVYSYPGLGHLALQAVNNRDFFLLQGVFLFIVIGALIANFVIDVVYVLVDPRTRTGMQGGTA